MIQNNEKARPAGGTAERAAETGSTEQVASLSISNNSTKSVKSRGGGISSLLMMGAENGLHLQDLVRITGQTERAVRRQIHAERRRGVPILSDNVCGYFLPSTDEERAACVRSLRHRAREILRAARAIEQGEG